MSSQSQRAKLLSLLKGRRGEWVSLPQVMDAGGAQYNARIYELRGLGYRIANRTKEVDGIRRSWFRLELSSAQTPITPRPATVDIAPKPESLFGEISPDRTYDE